MIISTGMADAEEIEETIEAAREGGCKELAILHCVSDYLAPAKDYNLRTIPDLIERFGLVALCRDSKTAWAVPGKVDYGRMSSEQVNVKFHRSLYFVKDLKAGNVITADAVRSVRSGFGLAPKYLDHVLGKHVKEDAITATPLLLENLI